MLEPSVPIRRELYRRWQGSSDDRISVHFATLPKDENAGGSLWLECALDGIILHDPSMRIASTLRGFKALITAGKVVRRITHGQGYWVKYEESIVNR